MISVIIPVHNEKKNLDQLLPYLVNIDNHLKMEVIVSQSSSNSDGSENLAVAGNITFIKCGQKGGGCTNERSGIDFKREFPCFLACRCKTSQVILDRHSA